MLSSWWPLLKVKKAFRIFNFFLIRNMDSQLDRHTRATTRKRALHKVDEVLQEFVCLEQAKDERKI